MQVGNSKVKKILVGDKVIYRDSDGWIPLELPDGVNGVILFRDKGDNTAELTGTLGFATTSQTYTTYSPGHLVLTPPQGYQFVDTDWKTDTENKSKMRVYGSRSTGGQAIMYTDATLQFSEGNISFSQIYNSQNVNGAHLILASFNRINTNYLANAEEDALPAIVNIKRV
ncbi:MULTISPECIES: hypothetical protein [Lactobacillaceae]|uniref:hypothetical protein n=1 Tax=Lactobacillaceae TaxID=33958 RepID=UPI00145726C1|nr:hypothetical protein [Lactobacillus sp. HBUAS51381]NLR08654.1 hypothetical protein [Lactobacillus sp. HBUAS51381]